MSSVKEERGCYLGIDTSNYTTSIAMVSEEGEVIANLRQLFSVKKGERGVRQSDAVFEHNRNLPQLMKQLETYLRPENEPAYRVLGVGYSVAPRRMKDSYMPCFYAGTSAAYAIHTVTDAPLVGLSHQEGHIMAALYSSGQIETLTQKDAEFIAFHVSGGTTDVLHVKQAEVGFNVELIGQSLDLHAGQAIDRIGVALDLDFPCGRALEKLAEQCTLPVPKPHLSVIGADCHLSGLENLALTLYFKSQNKALSAAYTLAFIGETLSAMTGNVCKRYPGLPLLYAGGVMSNQLIRRIITEKYAAFFAEPEFSADNATGVALLCRKAILKQ